MKILFFFFVSIFCCFHANAQEDLLIQLNTIKEDTNKVLLLDKISDSWYFKNPDSTFKYARLGLKLANDLEFTKGISLHKLNLGHASWESGDYPTALKFAFDLLEYKNKYGYSEYLFFNSYRDLGDSREALKWIDTVNDKSTIMFAALASCYYGLEKFDSTLFFLKRSMVSSEQWVSGWIHLLYARTYEKLNDPTKAENYYRKAIQVLDEEGNYKDLANAFTNFGHFKLANGSLDSAIYYANQAYSLTLNGKYQKEKFESYLLLANAFEKKANIPEALKYLKSAMEIKENIYGKEKQKQIEGLKFLEELRKEEERQRETDYKTQIRIYTLSGLLMVFVLFMIVLYRNNNQKQKANNILKATLAKLKSTQTQLIQSEKMASLGELTAGIAHEIQNPLNFVNNFSEMNKELLEELNDEIGKGNFDEVKSIAVDVIGNEEKINHHGKRASDIVKGMLEHSRKSTGEKEATDINALCDEYLRLAYQSQKAKDNGFNATMETHFDPNLPKIDIIPQDIGRVLLNLINNAFYTVNERDKKGETGYQPSVSITTKLTADNHLEIAVKDNGSGIPDTIKDKIFQPFFTTKPTGQGTGLGLSLAYDIVKAHGGELKMETKEGEGSTFIIQIPL
jgi:two-component system, NtrC family, sensor kinase